MPDRLDFEIFRRRHGVGRLSPQCDLLAGDMPPLAKFRRSGGVTHHSRAASKSRRLVISRTGDQQNHSQRRADVVDASMLAVGWSAFYACGGVYAVHNGSTAVANRRMPVEFPGAKRTVRRCRHIISVSADYAMELK